MKGSGTFGTGGRQRKRLGGGKREEKLEGRGGLGATLWRLMVTVEEKE